MHYELITSNDLKARIKKGEQLKVQYFGYYILKATFESLQDHEMPPPEVYFVETECIS